MTADDLRTAIANALAGEDAHYCGPGYGTCGTVTVQSKFAPALADVVLDALADLVGTGRDGVAAALCECTYAAAYEAGPARRRTPAEAASFRERAHAASPEEFVGHIYSTSTERAREMADAESRLVQLVCTWCESVRMVSAGRISPADPPFVCGTCEDWG